MNNLILYSSIKNQFQSSWHIPYQFLLRTYEWKTFRDTIVYRDNSKCTICFKEQSEKIGKTYYRKPNAEEIAENLKEITVDFFGDGTEVHKMKQARVVGVPTENPTILHVHHNYYIYGNLPWKYDKKVMSTVCHECHDEIHQTTKIKVYADETQTEIMELTPCFKCNGTGFLKEYHYYRNGICFDCNGLKFEELKEKT